MLTLPGLAIAGEVIIVDSSDNTHVSDVFRIFNDFLDTGNGTGIGLTAFLFSEDLGNLPDPSTFSPGAPRIIEGPSIGGGLSQTDFDFNGTSYSLFSSDDAAIPEPSTFVLAGLGGVLALWRRRLLSA